MKILLWCAVAFFAWAAAVPAGAGQGDLFTLDPETPWQIEADAITYDKTAQVYVAVGDVVITKEGKRLSADCVRFDQNGQRLFADGNVTMSAGSDILTGNHMDMDMAAETGTISGGTLFLADRHFYIIGDTIRKTGPDTYTADRVSFSSCEPGSPDWQITGRDLNLTVEGYGSLHHAAFWAGPAPLVYTPYLFFPVKIRRQTGFLVPQVQYSERKWEEIIQPFFWVISDSADMTFYAHHMGRRGEKLGFEYRQVFDAASKTTAMFDFMEDRKVNTVAGDEYGYDHDRWLRPNTDRYWFRMKQDNLLGAGVLAKLDIDFVSDQDYLLEFEDGYTGFDAADRYFAETFGRDLDDADDPVRTNIFNLQKSWARHSLNTSFRWEDDVIKRRWDLEDDTVQRLPVVSFDATKQKIGVTPFFYELNSEYLYGYTEDSLRGHRADMHPRIALPGRFKNFFSFEPSLGLRETVWQVERYGEESGEDRARSRELYDARLEMASELYRVFDLNPETGERLCHAIVPQIQYDYVPEKDQDTYPRFDDSIDIIEAANTVTYSVTNLLTFKGWQEAGAERETPPQAGEAVAAQSPAEALQPSRTAFYREVARFKLSQSYDINEAGEDDPAKWQNPGRRQPFSPMLAELDLRPSSFFRFDGDARWEPYAGKWTGYTGELAFSDARGDEFSGGYRYKQNASESVYGAATLVINDAFSLYADYERNIFQHMDILAKFGVIYRSSCWSVDVSYADEPDDRTYLVMFTLYGLGEIGTDISGADIESYP